MPCLVFSIGNAQTVENSPAGAGIERHVNPAARVYEGPASNQWVKSVHSRSLGQPNRYPRFVCPLPKTLCVKNNNE